MSNAPPPGWRRGISVKPLDEKLRKRRREKDEILKEKETRKWKIRDKTICVGRRIKANCWTGSKC